MLSRFRWILFLTVVLIASGCASQQHNLRLSEISSGLKPFEGSTYDVLVTGPVHYTTINEPEYDLFFQQVAAAYGSILFIAHTLDRLDEISTGKSQATALDAAVMATIIYNTLPQTERRIYYLVTEGQRLRDKADSDFAWKFYKTYQVRVAVKEAMANAIAIRDGLPKLAKRFKSIQDRVRWDKLIEQSF